MKINLGQISGEKVTPERITRLINDIEIEFEKVVDPTTFRRYSVALNFSTTSTVPGITDETVTIADVGLGDIITVGCSITAPAGFMPPIGFVSAANTVIVRWLQVTGSTADPDGSGATYYIDVRKHE